MRRIIPVALLGMAVAALLPAPDNTPAQTPFVVTETRPAPVAVEPEQPAEVAISDPPEGIVCANGVCGFAPARAAVRVATAPVRALPDQPVRRAGRLAARGGRAVGRVATAPFRFVCRRCR